VRRRAIAIVQATHPDDQRAPASVRRFVRYGASPRAARAIVLGAKVRAIAAGRDELLAADLAEVAPAALRHRLILNFEGQAENVEPEGLIAEILSAVAATDCL
jgi:MoxR-like ATPase